MDFEKYLHTAMRYWVWVHGFCNGPELCHFLLYVCFFLCVWFFVPLDNSLLIRRHHHYRWRVAIFFTYARDSWPLTSECSLACHTYCDAASVYNGHLRESMTPTPIAKRFSRGAAMTCFYDLGLSRLGFEYPTFRLRGERSNPLGQRRGMSPFKALSNFFFDFDTDFNWIGGC